VLLLSIVAVLVLMTLDRGRHLPTNGLTHELISIGGALVAHDVNILHPIYRMSSRVLLDSQTIQGSTLRVVVATDISLSTLTDDESLTLESITLLTEERVARIGCVHIVFLIALFYGLGK
jgi:hypothetical protein